MATIQGALSTDGSSDYYDILLLGRTGLGKSTTGNKLLGIAYEPLVKISETETVITSWDRVDGAVKYFVTGDTSESVTTECKLLSNERNCRVLDTPGFASSKLTEEYGGQKCNQQIFEWILQKQEKHDLAFHRVLYFLPNRGPLERAEGALQEEIKVMYDFMGQDIFNIMVIIATNQKGEKYQIEFDEEDITRTKKVFTAAFEIVTGTPLSKCPPVVYLPFTETELLKKVALAEVIADKAITKRESVVIDVMPTEDIDAWIQNEKQNYPGKRLCLRDKCSHCNSTLIYRDSPTGKWEVFKVVNENGEVACEQSKCHPQFILKHSLVVRIVLFLLHLAPYVITAGLCGKPCKAGSKKICPICRLPRGAMGCSDVGKQVDIEGQVEHIQISHSTHLDKMLDVL